MPEFIQVRVGTKSFDRLAERFAAAGVNVRPALARALNHTGDKTRTQVARALARQTGAKYGVIRGALASFRAGAGGLVYKIVAKGAFMSLKEFGARQTRSGVSAAPWNKRRIFPHTFIVATLGGHVFERTSKERFPIRKLWGPAIPREMVKDQSKSAFESTVAHELPPRIEHEIAAILGGSVAS